MPIPKRLEVLIADPHALMRDCIRRIADTPDIVVAGEARSVDEMLDRIGGRSYDLLVMEIAMDGCAGMAGIRQVKSGSPGTPILVLSSLSEERYAVDALRAGASGYLSKHCDSELLVSVMRKIARGGAFVSSRVAEGMTRSPLQHDRVGHDRLSRREHQVFEMINAGLGMSKIAQDLGVSAKTVSTHKARILEKLGVDSAVGLIRYAIDHQLVGTSTAGCIPPTPAGCVDV